MPSHDDNADVDTDEPPLRAILAGLERARKLVGLTLLALVIGTAVGWAYAGEMYRLLALPLPRELAARGQDALLTFTRLTDPFVLYFTVSLFAGLLAAMPVLAIQVYMVIAPRVRRLTAVAAVAFVVAFCGLFVAGAAFSYFVLIPFAVAYLLDVGSDFAQAVTVRDFLKFVVRLIVALGVAAQLPLVSLTAARIGLVNAAMLWRWFPYAIVLTFVMAAWLTPPDGMSQLLVAVPLLFLYLVGVGVAALAGRGRSLD